jgi:Na+/melibiose symporter-like transporter
LSTIAEQQPDEVTATALHSEKLSPLTKLAFGVGDLGPAIVLGISGFFLNAFLLDVAVRAYPNTRERHRQIRAELQRRNAGVEI